MWVAAPNTIMNDQAGRCLACREATAQVPSRSRRLPALAVHQPVHLLAGLALPAGAWLAGGALGIQLRAPLPHTGLQRVATARREARQEAWARALPAQLPPLRAGMSYGLLRQGQAPRLLTLPADSFHVLPLQALHTWRLGAGWQLPQLTSSCLQVLPLFCRRRLGKWWR